MSISLTVNVPLRGQRRQLCDLAHACLPSGPGPPIFPPVTRTDPSDGAVARARQVAGELFRAAVAGADAGAAVAVALDRDPLPVAPVRILAAGKAASTMADAAVRWLQAEGRPIAGGLVVGVEPGPPIVAGVEVVAGDHPVPGARSFAAARRLAEEVGRHAADEVALVLLSGGATSLVAGPVEGVGEADVVRLFERLLASGADIGRMNAIRKRYLRWGAGRLAAALAPAAVRCLAISDVAGDDPATIGSGPCTADSWTADRVLAATDALGALDPTLRARLLAGGPGALPETPKPGDPRLARVRTEVVLANRHALHAAAGAARRLGLSVAIVPEELAGPASDAGAACADRLLAADVDVVLWGGETTVALAAGSGVGGRAQELALAAAGRLAERGAAGVALLAAGTGGRDGPTDAAGAVVDAGSWGRSAAAGRDPAAALRRHDAYRALDAAGDLLRTGHTGTNVRDVVIGVRAG